MEGSTKGLLIIIGIEFVLSALIFPDTDTGAAVFLIALPITLIAHALIKRDNEEAEEKRIMLMQAQKVEDERKRKEDERKRKEDEAISQKSLKQKQRNFKDSFDRTYNDLKDNPELISSFYKFLPQVPTIILVYESCYRYFEEMILDNYSLGYFIIWSKDTQPELILSPDDPAAIDIEDFFNNKFFQMVRFLNENFNIGNIEAVYTVLRLLHDFAPSYARDLLRVASGVDFANIEHLNLEDCAYIYYSKCQRKFNNLYSDPNISYFTYFLIFHKKFKPTNGYKYHHYFRRRIEISNYLLSKQKDFEYRLFEENMKKEQAKSIYTIEDIDLMNGFEFENLVADIFIKMGYQAEVTKHSYDFGVDIIAEKNGVRVAIQAKCYVGTVSNSAIQEVVAGMRHYKCQKATVITNSVFSKSAVQLANSNSIELWDRQVLEEMLKELYLS